MHVGIITIKDVSLAWDQQCFRKLHLETDTKRFPKALAIVAQRSGCFIPGSVQNQTGQGFKKWT